MNESITTYTGAHLCPTSPDPQSLHIEDIAHALSLLCRGNGHVKTFFSVGQHCLFCAKEALARGYGRQVALACLLHDASEAYLSDVPRPFKNSLPQYRQWESQMLCVIYTKFLGRPLTQKEEAQVKEIDDDFLYYDLLHLLNEPSSRPAPQIFIDFSYDVLPFDEVEEAYLSLFFQLQKEECIHAYFNARQ